MPGIPEREEQEIREPAQLLFPSSSERMTRAAAEAASAPDPQYAPVYALLDEGVTDAQEITRRTGLSRGEVDLILGLRARQAFLNNGSYAFGAD